MLVLAADAYEAIVDHAREDAPREACGVLAGSRDGDVSRAAVAHRARNAADAPRVAYELDPREQLRLMDEIESAGRAVVGFYHSHPAGPAHMSETDREDAAWVGYHYVLVSLAGLPPFLGAWRWTGEGFERDDVRVDE